MSGYADNAHDSRIANLMRAYPIEPETLARWNPRELFVRMRYAEDRLAEIRSAQARLDRLLGRRP